METQDMGLKRRISIALILFGIQGWVTPSQAQSLLHPWQNRTTSSEGLVLEPRVGFFGSTENFGTSGTRTALNGNNEISWMLIETSATYAIQDSLYLFGRLTALSAKIRNSNIEASGFGLSDQLLGAAYRLYAIPDGLSINAQLDVTLPAYNNNSLKQKNQPFLGDGSTDITPGAFIEAPLPWGSRAQWYAEGGAGLRIRSAGFSTAVPWSLIIKKEPIARGLLLSAGVRGQFSLDTDTTSPAAALPDQLMGGAGSGLINAINPSWTTAQATIGYKTRHGQSLYALAQLPLAGTNAATGLHFALGIQFDFSSPAKKERGELAPQGTALQRPPRQLETVIQPKTTQTQEGFQSYDLDAEVVSTQEQLYLAKLDKGRSDGIEVGQVFDLFKKTTDGMSSSVKEIRVARARVTAVKNSEAALTITEYFVDQWVEAGFTAKRLVQ